MNKTAGCPNCSLLEGAPSGASHLRVIYQPTGPCHRTFERKRADTGLALVKVNPRLTRWFAEATGKLARPIGWKGACWRAWVHCSNSRPDRSGVQSSVSQGPTHGHPRSHNGEQLRQIEHQIAAIEAKIMTRIKADPELGSLNNGQAASRGRCPSQGSRTRVQSRRPGQDPAGGFIFGPWYRNATVFRNEAGSPTFRALAIGDLLMFRGVLLWLIGIPIPIILVLWFLGYLS